MRSWDGFLFIPLLLPIFLPLRYIPGVLNRGRSRCIPINSDLATCLDDLDPHLLTHSNHPYTLLKSQINAPHKSTFQYLIFFISVNQDKKFSFLVTQIKRIQTRRRQNSVRTEKERKAILRALE